MSACISKRVKRKVYWSALVFLGHVLAGGIEGVGRSSKKQSVGVQGIPIIVNLSSSAIMTAIDKYSAVTHAENFLENNHTLLLEINGTTLAHDSKKSSCRCWNSTDDFLEEVQCKCEGPSIVRIPQKLTAMQKLILENIGIKRLRENALLVYAEDLRDL